MELYNINVQMDCRKIGAIFIDPRIGLRFLVGYGLVMDWSWIGFGLVLDWSWIGLGLFLGWSWIDLGLVFDWSLIGFGLVLDWSLIGLGLVLVQIWDQSQISINFLRAKQTQKSTENFKTLLKFLKRQ